MEKEEKELSEKDKLLLQARLEEAENRDDGQVINQLRQELGILIAQQEESMMLEARVKWTEENEKCTKYFYNRIRSRIKNANIDLLLDEQNREIEDIHLELYNFYKNLYTERLTDGPDQF